MKKLEHFYISLRTLKSSMGPLQNATKVLFSFQNIKAFPLVH